MYDWLITQFGDAINMRDVKRILADPKTFNVVATDSLEQVPHWALPIGTCATQEEAEAVVAQIACRFACGDNPVMFCECLDGVRTDNPKPTKMSMVEINPPDTDEPRCLRCRDILSDEEYDRSVKLRHAPYCPRCLTIIR